MVNTSNVNIDEEGSITANGKKFLDIVRILKDERERETDRQTDRQTNSQTQRQRQTETE